MIRKANRCDREDCGDIHMLDPDEYQTYLDEGTAEGWVRLFINKPRNYAFTDTQRSEAQGWYDVCSIGCATSVLYEARESVPSSVA
jgi:hypothetical protein